MSLPENPTIMQEVDSQRIFSITELVKTFSPWQWFRRQKFKSIFFSENYCILIKISQKFVWEGSFDNKLALIEVMAWYRTSAKLFPEHDDINH